MNKEPRILVISSGPPVDTGGGSRRTGQLLHELKCRFGEGAVAFLSRADIALNRRAGLHWLRRGASRAMARLDGALANPFQLLADGYGFGRLGWQMQANYRAILSQLPNIEICIVEHLEFAPLHELHSELGIRTILAPWFVGSMTLQAPYFMPALKRVHSQSASAPDRLQVRAAFTHLANEILLAAAVERSWFPSRMEAGFFTACGLHAGYLPYYPAGEAIDQLHRLRAKRSKAAIDDGLFVVTGSSIDHSRISTLDFIQRPDIAEFPANARIEIVGTSYSSSDRALAAKHRNRIVFRGRLPQPEFEDLLVRARAVLVPQTCGYGVSTRVVDMLTAGIPVIADEMTANATGAMPGVQYAADAERGWSSAIEAAMEQPSVVPAEAIEPWLQLSKKLVAQELSRLGESR